MGRIPVGISKVTKIPLLGTYVVILLLILHPGFTSTKKYTIATKILKKKTLGAAVLKRKKKCCA